MVENGNSGWWRFTIILLQVFCLLLRRANFCHTLWTVQSKRIRSYQTGQPLSTLAQDGTIECTLGRIRFSQIHTPFCSC